jgi:hypothetical protein
VGVAPLAVLALSAGTISRRAIIGRDMAREAARLSKSGSLSARIVGNSHGVIGRVQERHMEGRAIMSSHFIDQCTWDVNTVDYVPLAKYIYSCNSKAGCKARPEYI